MADLYPIQVTVNGAPAKAPHQKVQAGDRVVVTMPEPEEPQPKGEITPKGDPATKTFRVYLPLPDDTPLRIGMSVEANIVIREKADALVVAPDALSGAAVFVFDGERLSRREVKIGLRGARGVEILDGLSERDRVVSPARPDYRDGMRARAAPGAS